MEVRVMFGSPAPEERSNLVKQYRTRLQANPNEHGTRYMLGTCLFSLGQTEEARAQWDSLLGLHDPFWKDIIERSLKIVEQGV